YSQFLITDMSLVRIDGLAPAADSAGRVTRSVSEGSANQRPENFIPIGGRFFYRTDAGVKNRPARFDHTHTHRLIYHDKRWRARFAGSMSAWLRAGNLDLDGNVVREDRFIADNVTVSFDAHSMIIHTHALPNHPTGKFPGENPNYIQEKDATYY